MDVKFEAILDFVSLDLNKNITSNGYCQNMHSENVLNFF